MSRGLLTAIFSREINSMSKILILSSANDPHALMIQAGLLAKGANVTLWCTADFPTLISKSITIDKFSEKIRIHGPELEINNDDYTDIWNRRPSLKLPDGVLHQADRVWAERNCRIFQSSVYGLVGRNAFWVNPPYSDTDKLNQQILARGIGFETPDSIYSNDPDAIREFINKYEENVIFKPFYPGAWRSKDTGKMFGTGTKRISITDLVDDDIMACSPGIFQELIPKDYEVRVTVFGRHIVAVRLFSQETQKGKLDYRNAYDELRFEYFEIDTELSKKIFKLMEKLGIVYGALDFIVRPGGETVFLEINESGQFLFIEEACGVPILDAFCDFLIYAKNDFQYSYPPNPVRLADVAPSVKEGFAEFIKKHETSGNSSIFEECDMPGAN